METKQFGLIGRGISHSFSASYFNKKFVETGYNAVYSLFDLTNISDFESIKGIPDLSGLNVTSPYKREIIPFLDELSDEALLLNAVNVIEFIHDSDERTILKGHNTDSEGFRKTIENLNGLNSALILGSGGAASAVGLALKNSGIAYHIVSRNPKENEISYNEANQILPSTSLIINATPVGMHPNTSNYPLIDYEKLSPLHVCYDLIYNPSETLFLKLAKSKGTRTLNGLQMLINQAELAWNIWQNCER